MATYVEMMKMSEDYKAQAIAARASEVDAIKAKITELGIKPEELGFPKREKSAKKTRAVPGPAKYGKGNQTWTGKGRAPQWVNDHIAAGGNMGELLLPVQA